MEEEMQAAMATMAMMHGDELSTMTTSTSPRASPAAMQRGTC